MKIRGNKGDLGRSAHAVGSSQTLCPVSCATDKSDHADEEEERGGEGGGGGRRGGRRGGNDTKHTKGDERRERRKAGLRCCASKGVQTVRLYT